jgi:hypothetical protein
MSADLTTQAVRPALRLRADGPEQDPRPIHFGLPLVFLLASIGFVVIGGGNLELGPTEAKVGLSAVEPLGPFGQTLGGWEPGVWVGSVIPCRLWALASGMANAAIVRWPTVIAGIVIGLFLARGMRGALGARAGGLATLCWFGGVALIDRSSDAGIDLIAGLGTILALNRMLTKGSDWVAGLLASWAFLAGGWPPLAMIALATILLGRSGASFSIRLIVPVVATVAGWSAWALATTRSQVWAAALSLPLTQGSAWTMALGVIGLGLPWSPLALLAFSVRLRDGWNPQGRAFVVGWGQVALASLVVGTVIPGLASAARMPALAGLAIVAAASLESVLTTELSPGWRRWLHLSTLTIVLTWLALMIYWAGGLALAVAYYRQVAIVLIALALATTILALMSAWKGDRRGTLAAIVLIAASVKLAHWGHHVPEWNYRHSQAPWGRAIGQWLPHKRTIHVLHGWPADLIFAIGRPVRSLVDPRLLPDRPGPDPKFILLLQSEFDHWMPNWPKLVFVARFEDEWGDGRILARTEGPFSWRKAATDDAAGE